MKISTDFPLFILPSKNLIVEATSLSFEQQSFTWVLAKTSFQKSLSIRIFTYCKCEFFFFQYAIKEESSRHWIIFRRLERFLSLPAGSIVLFLSFIHNSHRQNDNTKVLPLVFHIFRTPNCLWKRDSRNPQKKFPSCCSILIQILNFNFYSQKVSVCIVLFNSENFIQS